MTLIDDKLLQNISKLKLENKILNSKLKQAEESIENIETENIDAFVVGKDKKAKVFTRGTADQTYRLFIQKMSEGAVTLNSDGLILYSNMRFAGMVNMPIENIIGSNFHQFIPVEFKKTFDDLFTLSWKNDARGELFICSKFGVQLPVMFSLAQLQLQDSLALSIVITDLTKQKAEQKELNVKNQLLKLVNEELASNTKMLEGKTIDLLRKQQQFEEAQKIAHLGSWEWDLNTNIISWSDELFRIYALSAQQFIPISGSAVKYIHPNDKEFVNKITASSYKDKKPFSINYHIIDENKKERFVHEEVKAIINSDNKVVKMYGTLQDITEQKKVEELLIESRARIHKLFNASLSGILVSNNTTGKITEANDSFIKILGYEQEEVIGHNISELNLVEPEVLERIRNKFKHSGFIKNEEIEIRKKSGEKIIVLYTVTGTIVNGELSILGIILDITEQKKVQELKKEKLLSERLTAAKDQFFSSMSHEIRTPLNSIIGFTKLLLQNGITETQREQLEAVKTSGDILLVLINDILDLSKIDAGKIHIEETELKLDELIKTVITSFELRFEEKKLSIVNIFDKHIPKIIMGDPVRIEQILLNLINNAFKFTNEGGEICIQTTLQKEDNKEVYIEFNITDNGIGIPSEKLETIFEPFIQAGKDTTRKYGGTGLGLSIVNRLVKLMKGTVSVKSKVNEGSTFSFILPLQKTSATQVSKESKILLRTSELKEIGHLKILLAEDTALNQFLIETIMHNYGFEVDAADNGKIAIECMEKKDYDIILMDLMMPEMDGYQATKHIRTKMKKPKSSIPIIALTADVNNQVVKKCTDVGMNDYISKPFNEIELLNKMSHLVKKFKDKQAEKEPIIK